VFRYMVHIGRIYLVIRTQNKAEVSIRGDEIFSEGFFWTTDNYF